MELQLAWKKLCKNYRFLLRQLHILILDKHMIECHTYELYLSGVVMVEKGLILASLYRPHCTIKHLINPSNSVQNGQLKGKCSYLIILHDTLSLSETSLKWKMKQVEWGGGRVSLRSAIQFLLAPKYGGTVKHNTQATVLTWSWSQMAQFVHWLKRWITV